MTGANQAIRHEQRRSILIRVAWVLAFILVAVLVFVVAVPIGRGETCASGQIVSVGPLEATKAGPFQRQDIQLADGSWMALVSRPPAGFAAGQPVSVFTRRTLGGFGYRLVPGPCPA